MSKSQFSRPGTAGESQKIVWKDLFGALLIIEPVSVEHDIQTALGARDAVRASVTVIDGVHAGNHYPDALIFPRAMQGQLGRQLGAKVLGRLGKGVAKPGQDAPWVLDYANEKDEEAAAFYLSHQNGEDDLEAPF